MTRFEELLYMTDAARVVPASRYMEIDLSAESSFFDGFDAADARAFEAKIDHLLLFNGADAAIGGYLEKRLLYNRSGLFADEAGDRNIHIGLDIWMPAGTHVMAALDGIVHSFADNDRLGDYGPTIILQHSVNSHRFYTLYGHLSRESLYGKSIGQTVQGGSIIGHLGDASVNGDYAPHLHFQIVEDLSGTMGDYPGVCTEDDLNFYRSNCPDPNLLLKIESL